MESKERDVEPSDRGRLKTDQNKLHARYKTALNHTEGDVGINYIQNASCTQDMISNIPVIMIQGDGGHCDDDQMA